jgi:hypothetical protein
MPAIIDSSPSCVASIGGAEPADDSADFVVGAAYEECAGFGTFMPGSTYGEEGAGAAGAYMAIVWWENRRLKTWLVAKRGGLIPD